MSTFGSYLRGTALVALVDAVGIGIGLLILQVPLALPLVVLIFVLSFIPIVGAVRGGSHRRPGRPRGARARAVRSSSWASSCSCSQLEGNILQPFLMGRSMRLNAFVVLIALAAGTVLGGILGAILAVPLTAAAWGVVQVWDGPDTPARWARRKRPEGDARDTLPNRVAQRSLDRPKAERAAQPKGA